MSNLDKKTVISISEDRELINKVDGVASTLGIDRSKIIGDLMEKSLDDYKAIADFIDENIKTAMESGKGFCQACCLSDWKESHMVQAISVYSDLELLGVDKVIEKNSNSTQYGKHISSMYKYKCKKGHGVTINVPVFMFNPFAGKNEMKMRLKAGDIKRETKP